jgi:hypothetical protein
MAIATRSPLAIPAPTSALASRVAWPWSSANVIRSSPQTTPSTAPFSWQKMSNSIGRVGGKLLTIARPCSSCPIRIRPPGVCVTAASTAS